MLQLKHIRKSYTTGDFTQTALNDVSVWPSWGRRAPARPRC